MSGRCRVSSAVLAKRTSAVLLVTSLAVARDARALEPGVVVFAVNSYTTGTQSEPVVAAQGSGRYVVVWTSAGQDGDAEGIFARIVDEHSTALSPDIAVNVTTAGSQAHPSVDATQAGDFVVTWQSGTNAVARKFTALGEPTSGEITVAENVLQAPVAIDEAGRIAMTYRRADILMQRFDATLAPIGSEVTVNEQASSLGEPEIAMNAAGDFVVAWHDETYVNGDPELGTQYYRYSDVFLAHFAADGTRGDTIEVAPGPEAGNEKHFPRPDMTDEGFVVAMSGCYSVPGDYQARPCTYGGAGAQRFTSEGMPATPALSASGARGDYGEIPPADAVLHDSRRFTVVWNGPSVDNTSDGIFARQFATTAPDIPHQLAVPFSKTFLLDPAVDGNRATGPRVDANHNDRFLAVWARDGDIYAAAVRNVGICTDYSICRPPAADTGRLSLRRDLPERPDAMRFVWVGETTARSCVVDEGVASNAVASFLTYDHPGGPPRTIVDASLDAPICGSPPCWRYEGPYRVVFEDPAGEDAGITKVRFRVGPHGRAKLVVRLAGGNLSNFPLPLVPPVNVAFSGRSFCAHAQFTEATTNTVDRFFAEGAIDFSPQ